MYTCALVICHYHEVLRINTLATESLQAFQDLVKEGGWNGKQGKALATKNGDPSLNSKILVEREKQP